jgi:bifunctional ADP-heptose synthase (sugar kinase/adenylyltransferase)
MEQVEIRELTKAFGWHEVASKNPHMLSFRHEERKERLDVYYTTGTFALLHNGINRYFRNADLLELEMQLSKIK